MDKPTVWVLDDDLSVLRAIRRLIEAMSCACTVFSSGFDLLSAMEMSQPDLLILDIHMPAISGLDVLSELRDRGVTVPVVMMTGVERDGMRDICCTAGALDVLGKPLGMAEIGAVLMRVGLMDQHP